MSENHSKTSESSDSLVEPLRKALEEIYASRSMAHERAEHKRSDRDLRESHERLARVLDLIPVGVSVINVDGRLLFANGEAERILRITHSRIAGIAYDDSIWRIRPIPSRPEEENREQFLPEEKILSRVIEGGETVHGLEAYVTSPDSGSLIPIRVSAAPLRDADGNTLGIVTAFQDISEELARRRARRWERSFLRRVLGSCTGGTLRLVETAKELPERLPSVEEPTALVDAAAHGRIRAFLARQARSLGFEEERVLDLVTAVGEACDNAREHSHKGVVHLCAVPDPPTLQVWIQDQGPSWEGDLHSNTSPSSDVLERIAPGFQLIVAGCDRAYLYLDQHGTTLVLEAEPGLLPPQWLLAGRTNKELTDREKAFLHNRSRHVRNNDPSSEAA